MNLRDLPVTDYLSILASGAPAPGGGSAAALSAAQGAALGAMVTELSIGKKKYLDHTDHLTATRDALGALASELTLDVDRDTQAFEAVSEAMKLPKDSDAEKVERSKAMQEALLAATLSPLNVLGKCKAALQKIDGLLGCSNTNAASDLGTGAAMLRSAAQGAWLNVLINLSSLKDAQTVQDLYGQAKAAYDACLTMSDAIFAKIEAQCMPQGV